MSRHRSWPVVRVRAVPPQIWDVRSEREEHRFGTFPNSFVEEEAHRLPENSSVVEIGAGEARTLAWLARAHGPRTTAVDFSEVALETAQRWPEVHDLALETIGADVRRGL